MPDPTRTRVFWSGNSQAVRLPREFRLDVSEVLIRREGDRLVLEPLPRTWSDAMAGLFGAAPDLDAPADPPLDAATDL